MCDIIFLILIIFATYILCWIAFHFVIRRSEFYKEYIQRKRK